MGAVHVLKPRLHVPVHLRADRRQRILAAGRKRYTTVLHFRARGQPECVSCPKSTSRLDLLDHGRAAAKQGVPMALALLDRNRLTEPVERAAVFRVDIVFEEFVGALADMCVHIDHGVAVPAHVVLRSRRADSTTAKAVPRLGRALPQIGQQSATAGSTTADDQHPRPHTTNPARCSWPAILSVERSNGKGACGRRAFGRSALSAHSADLLGR